MLPALLGLLLRWLDAYWVLGAITALALALLLTAPLDEHAAHEAGADAAQAGGILARRESAYLQFDGTEALLDVA